jgi:hypothetical protein
VSCILLHSILYLHIVIVKIITGRERTKYLKAFLGSLFSQPISSHRFWFVQKKSLAASFGSNDNHIQSVRVHT